MECFVSVLGGGSKGNSVVFHNANNAIMIDAGFSRKEICKRLDIVGIPHDKISALLITHEHSDHVKGARVFADTLDIPTYLTSDTFRILQQKNQIGQETFLFSPGASFKIDEWKISPFLVPHDATMPVGFVIETDHIKIGIATDLGYISKLTEQKLYDCDVLIIESNYDLQMLRNAVRPLSLKQRITSRHGHLNNVDTMKALGDLITPRTKYLFLTHLSSDCNTSKIVKESVEKELKKLQRSDIVYKVVEQLTPTETIKIK